MADVVALGELLIDFAALETDKAGYPTMKANPGGAPCNYLAALSKYGISTAFLGKVGTDAFGELLIGSLQQAGIDTAGVMRDDAFFTTLAFVTITSSGDRVFSFARKPGADTQLRPEEIDFSAIDGCKVFHFGTLSLTQEPICTVTRTCVDYAKKHGKLLTFDPNLRLPLWDTEQHARKEIDWGLRHADVVKISDNEVRFMWDESPAAGCRRLLAEYGAKLVMVTLGADGCILANRCHTVTVPALRVTPKDTTGAGDIFGGSAVSRLLHTGCAPEALSAQQLTEIGTFACCAASLSTACYGGISSVPDEESVREAIANSAV